MRTNSKWRIAIGVIPAVLILIFACGVAWWAAILICLLANFYIEFEVTSTYR